jgi:hypothetical protein
MLDDDIVAVSEAQLRSVDLKSTRTVTAAASCPRPPGHSAAFLALLRFFERLFRVAHRDASSGIPANMGRRFLPLILCAFCAQV